LTEAPVLERADGYIKRRYVDIGDRVKLGQLPADITAPDLDQQVQQARAQLLQARAALRQSNAPLEQARANQTLENSTLTTGASNLVNRSPNRNCSPVARWQEASL
jgi:multidrug efflux pump subunit AcrA (membrane-fusion protein)